MGASLNDIFGGTSRTTTATDDNYGIRPTGYRLPESTHIRSVALQVTNLERSRDFYENVLGFHAIALADGRATLAAHGSETGLIELVENRDGSPNPARKALGLYHVAILLPSRADLGRFLRHLEVTGARAGAGDHLVSEALYLQDPDNLGIEVYADRPRSTWRAQNRELVMATDPVDVRSLLAAGGDTAWTGVPVGTTIGHVHLHVGDLQEGARFYADAIGFDKVVWSYPGALFLAAGGYHHHLGTNTWAGAGAEPASPHDAQLLEWTLVLPTPEDVQAVASSLRAAGYSASEQGGDVITRDPWGTTLRLQGA